MTDGKLQPIGGDDELVTKHPGGRPLLFKTPEEMKKVIDEYFEWCDNRAIKIWDEKTQNEIMISKPAPYTMSGLARRLGIDRQTLINYKNKDEFFDTIREARERVHEDVENRLMETRNEKGAIFNLKNNFGWKEEPQVVQQFNVGGDKGNQITFVNFSNESGGEK